ncbi:hypothetical protein CSC12_0481 [Klebsiella michiganensis]|nr:hypothetical protein CSC12_0481 [Klebsiella michiganensis]
MFHIASAIFISSIAKNPLQVFDMKSIIFRSISCGIRV